MSHTSRETSPDPLSGPTSPMSSRWNLRDRSPIRTRRTSKPLASRSHNIESPNKSPSKSFVMNTGAPGDASPWRIKVTVQAEPQDGSSPTKRVTRTTKVPLKGSSSPVKKSPKKISLQGDSSEPEIKRPRRKRKGTPIRRNVKRASPLREVGDETSDADVYPTGGIEMSEKLQEELSSPTKGPVTRAKRKGTPKPSPAERARRLSKAKAELQDNGETDDSDGHQDIQDEDADFMRSDTAPGDMTVANEDFTMISVATLESMKQGNSSQLLDNSGFGDKSAASVSYMPSSPPRPVEEQNDDAIHSNSGQRFQNPNSSRQEERAKRADSAVENQSAYDEMSWKPTGPLRSSSMLAKSKAKEQTQQCPEPTEWRLQREAVSREIDNASASQVITIDSSNTSSAISGAAEAERDEDDEQAQLGAEEEDIQAGGEDDIWAEEASRSLEEDQQPSQHEQQSSTAAALNELFSDGASKPARGKIPRTWRRTSGMDFSYVDSPAHGALKSAPEETRKVSATSNASSGNEGGVLTPPESSFEEDEEKEDALAEADEAGDVDVDLTHPDAAATLLQVNDSEAAPKRRLESSFAVPKRPARRNRDTTANTSQVSIAASTSTNSLTSNGSAQSNGEEDTGMFWQTHLPNVFQQPRQRKWGSKLLEERRNRKKALELSEILKSSSNIEEEPKPAERTAQVEKSEVRISEEKATSGLRHETKPSTKVEKVVDSPLRKSLLKSSKLGGSKIPTPAGSSSNGSTSQLSHSHTSNSSRSADSSQAVGESSISESFNSKASDQRQLLDEMNLESARSQSQGARSRYFSSKLPEPASEDDIWVHSMSEATYDGQSPANSVRYAHMQAEEVESYEEEEDDQDEYDEHERSHEQSHRSYEEHLNLDSPMKIKVNFGNEDHSQSHNQSHQSYEEQLNLDSPMKIKVNFNDSEGNSSLLARSKACQPLFGNAEQPVKPTSKHKHTISAPAVPQGPGIFSRLTSNIWFALVRPSGPTMVDPSPAEPEFSPSLRSQIRSRYGVLSDQFPWTMAHMRTLHRLLNSCTTNKSDSLVPRSGPLPSSLKSLVGKELQCATEFRWKFTRQHAHVVDAFMQTLVPEHFIDAIRSGEVAPLGDDFAIQYRGEWAGRHGDDAVWDEETVAYYPYLKTLKGTIHRSFVVKAIGNAVSANIETAEREAKDKEERTRIEMQRKAWEKKNGFVHHDEDESLSTVNSNELEE